MSHADRHDAAQEVEVLLALGVPNKLALGVVNHHRVLEIRGDTIEKKFLFLGDDFISGHGVLL